MTSDDCDHKWIYIEGKRRTEDTGFKLHWILTERFFCEKCLAKETTVQDEYSRDPPVWW